MAVKNPLQDVLQNIYRDLDARLIPQKKTKKTTPHRIKWRGKFVRLSSGKTVWKKIGDAKSAFRNEIANEVFKYLEDEIDDYPSREEREVIVQLIFNSGLVEFVPVGEYD